jgi:oleate hydratase
MHNGLGFRDGYCLCDVSVCAIGLEDKIDQILKHSCVSIAAMPYITSQFMPRRIADRPKVIPDGCVNLAFIGQFVETPADVSFTVESSVRTAMMAVWGLTGLKKPEIPMYEPLFDVRVIAKSLKMASGSDTLNLEIIDKIRSSTGGSTGRLVDAALSHIPDPVPSQKGVMRNHLSSRLAGIGTGRSGGGRCNTSPDQGWRC